MGAGVFDTIILGEIMELNYIDGLKVARDLAKQNKFQTLDGLIEALEEQQIETAALVLDVETR